MHTANYLPQTEDEKGLRIRWELVQEALLRNILSSHQLESAILSYNSRYNEKWNFSALHSLFNEVSDIYMISENVHYRHNCK